MMVQSCHADLTWLRRRATKVGKTKRGVVPQTCARVLSEMRRALWYKVTSTLTPGRRETPHQGRVGDGGDGSHTSP